MRSLLVLGMAAAVFALFLVRNERRAQSLVRAEDVAVERLASLVAGPPGPPRIEGGYRFEWAQDGDLPAVLLAFPDDSGVCLFAAAPGGGVYAYELFGEEPPDTTPVRVHVARGSEGAPAGWRKVR